MKRFAVIGVGRMGRRHADNLALGRVRGACLAAVCDTDKRVLDICASKYKGVKVYSDYKDLIACGNVDAVVIAVPHYSHADIAVASIEAGLHTLVEKPLSVTCKQAERIVEAADKNSGVAFGIMYNQRTNAVYSKIRDIVLSGDLGAIKRVSLTVSDWYRTQYYYDLGGWRASYDGEGGGTLINQCVHQLDVLQWIIGMPEWISADCKTVGRNIGTENDVTAILGYGGFNCTLAMSAHEFPGVNRLEIAGEKGIITAGKFSAKVKINKYSEGVINSRAKRDYGNKADKKYCSYKLRYGIFNLIRDGLYGQQLNILKDFSAFINGKRKYLLADGRDGVNALMLINGIYMSDWKGVKVNLPFDTSEYEDMLNIRRAKERERKQ